MKKLKVKLMHTHTILGKLKELFDGSHGWEVGFKASRVDCGEIEFMFLCLKNHFSREPPKPTHSKKKGKNIVGGQRSFKKLKSYLFIS